MSKRHVRGTPEFHLDSSALNRVLREDRVQAVIRQLTSAVPSSTWRPP
jgi:hypothetical protein